MSLHNPAAPPALSVRETINPHALRHCLRGRTGPVSTTAIFFPFDLFGSRGAGAGAELLADAFRELLADNRREQVPTRARAYAGQLRLREYTFETQRAYDAWRRRGRAAARRVLDRGDFLLWLAGNHLGVLPVYDELSRLGNTLVVQLDAHLDIYHLSDCTAELSHGNFLMHCAGPLPPLVNFGHRELLLRPDHVAAYYRATFPASALAVDPAPALAYLRRAARAAARVFIDLDCDVFDRAYFPAVANPVPFGLSPQLVLRLLDAVWSERVLGLAVSEFDPARDAADHSLATLMWLLEYLLLKRYEVPAHRKEKA
jgi:arginase family enzyme